MYSPSIKRVKSGFLQVHRLMEIYRTDNSYDIIYRTCCNDFYVDEQNLPFKIIWTAIIG